MAQKLRRRKQTALRMLPAYQRFCPHQFCAMQVDLGLVIQYELIVLQSVPDTLEKFVLVTGIPVQRGIVNMEAILARLLGHVHGLIGVPE